MIMKQANIFLSFMEQGGGGQTAWDCLLVISPSLAKRPIWRAIIIKSDK
jgi:hypothetical protein